MLLLFTLSLSLFLNVVFLMLLHPMSMMFILVAQTLIISAILFSLINFAWFSYSLILVFLGGMLVIFMYMSNVASDEIFKPNLKIFLGFPVICLSMLFMNAAPLFNNSEQMIYSTELFTISKPFYYSILPVMIITALMIIIAMLAVVKIAKMQLGPLRVN